MSNVATNHIQQSQGSKMAMVYAEMFGLTLTSGWRDPKKNASVGGSSKSMHVQGTAFDFAGTPTQMKKFAEWAKKSGWFTEVIYGTADHKDHVHVGWGTGKHGDGKMYVGTGTVDKPTPNGGDIPVVDNTSGGGGMWQGIIDGSVRVILIFLFLIVGVALLLQAFPATSGVVPTPANIIKKGVKQIANKKR